MRIELTCDVKLVGGEVLHKGARFDVLENEPVGPLVDDKPVFLHVSVVGKSVWLDSLEFDVLEQADDN